MAITYVGIKNADESVLSIRISDYGEPYYAGRYLTSAWEEHYKVYKLMDAGCLCQVPDRYNDSYLDTMINTSSNSDRPQRVASEAQYYSLHRRRGRYLYLFKNGHWYVQSNGRLALEDPALLTQDIIDRY